MTMTPSSSRPLLAGLLALLSLSFSAAGQEPAAEAPAVLLTGVRLIDGTGSPARENTSILLGKGRIIEIGIIDAEAAKSRGVRVVDASGKTAIPGLISAHSHVGLISQGAVKPENFTRETVQAGLQQYAGYGVTTVMSLGMNQDVLFQIRNDQRAGRLSGADVLSAGRGLGFTDGAPPLSLPAVQLDRVGTPEEARVAVRRMAEADADMIKLWTDTVLGKAKRMPTDILSAIIDEAHFHKLKVAAHLYYLEGGKTLLNNGLDIVAHSVRDQPVDDEFITLMKQKGASYIPTLNLDETLYAYGDAPAWMKLPAFRKAADPTSLEKWEGAFYMRQIQAHPDTPKHRAGHAMAKQNLKKLHDAGVHIGFGTDSGANPNRLPGWAEHRELQLYVEAGISPMDAIVCATKNAATILGLEKGRGTLEPGKKADLILLDANPLEDIQNTLRIHTIYHAGRLVALAF